MTNFPGGIQGSPVVGADHFGWKYKSAYAPRAWFVDGVSGTDGSEGSTPESALATIGRAIFLASAYDVIYVLDKGLSGTDPNPYREVTANLSVAYAKNNLAIVGVPHNIHDAFSVQIKAAETITTPILTVRAPFCAIENLDFNGTGDALARGNIVFRDDGNTTNQAQGSSIYNCHIRNGKGSAGVATEGGGVVIAGGWYYTIKNCRFHRCRVGVRISSAGATVLGVRIEDNLFTNDDLSIVDTVIYMVNGPHYATTIRRNTFGHAKGTYAGAASKYHTLLSDGILSDNYFACTGLTWGATGKTGGDIPITFFMCGNYDETGITART